MTYPPPPGQPPYGQQPGDPYGQQPGNPYGTPSGGFPQQGGQYPQGYPQVPYGQQGGFGPQPPKKSKTGLWVGLGIGVVAVVVFVITAFVAPGFLLSDDDDDSTSGGGGNSSGAQALAEKIRDGLIANDTATLQQLACPDATDMVQGAIQSASELADVRIDGQAQENGDTATVKATVTLDGVGVETGITNTFAKQNGEWCWQDLTFNVSNMPGPGEMSDIPSMPPAPSIPSVPSPGSPGSASDIGSSGSSGGVEAFLQQFGEALNAGDAETLQGMLCPAATGAEEIEKALAAGDNYTMEDRIRNEGSILNTSFVGSDGRLSVYIDSQDEPLCVFIALYL